MSQYHFYSSCVGWPRNKVTALSEMIDNARTISRRTFLKHVNRLELVELEEQMGYAKHPKQGLTFAADWAILYHRSKLNGKTVYYFRHSAIEYVFTQFNQN